jgi:hypothetical protein
MSVAQGVVMIIRSWQRILARRMAAALLAAPALASQTTACGPLGGCPPPPPDKTVRITYTACSSSLFDAAASDGSDDAAMDAAEGGATDAASDGAMEAATEAGSATDASADGSIDPSDTPCFTTCTDACQAMDRNSDVTCQPVSRAGNRVIVDCTFSAFRCVGGRLTDGLAPPELAGDVLGAFFAESAWLEAASIHSFERLARELADHAAPDELVQAARTAAKDEARHARALARLARKYDAEIPRVVHRDGPTRSLEAIAIENAVEGCVGETYGALVAHWQAEHASDREVREAMATIAPEELSHAALAWAIAEWADARLDAEARDRVRDARDAAREVVLDAKVDRRIAEVAGAPTSEIARALVTSMFLPQ